MSDSKVMKRAKLNYSMDSYSDTESTMNLDRDELKKERDFTKWIIGVQDGDFDNRVSTFQAKYLSLAEGDGVTQLHKACACGDLEQVTLLCDTSNIETGDKFNYRPIHVTCIFGHLGIVEHLHRNGCDIDAPAYFGTRPLHLAAKYGSVDAVKYLCSHQCELDVPLKNLWRPIHLACRFEHTEIVKHLCEQGCFKEVLTDLEEQPLHIACIHGHLEIVRLLCEQKCDIEASTLANKKPFHLACTHGHLDIVMFLSEQNCDIGSTTSNNKGPLHLACTEGHLDIVRFLSEQNCDIEAKTSDKYTPLHLACTHGHLDIVSFLSEQNCDIEAKSLNNKRPLHLACSEGHLDIVRFLCKRNCGIEAMTSLNERPIHIACEHGHLKIVTFLCERNCDIEAPGMNNNRPIHYACENGHLDIVIFLWEQNCDIESKTVMNERPIHIACDHGHMDIVRFLCERNCDIEAPGMNDNRPLHYACKNNRLDIVMLLCESNCDIEAPGRNDNRPIHYACKHGYLDIVRFLWEQNCDIESTTLMKDRPIDMARKYGHTDIVKYLYERRNHMNYSDTYRTVDTNYFVQNWRDVDAFTKMNISVLPGKSAEQQLIQKISNMTVECYQPCDHYSCFQSILSTKTFIGRGGFGSVYKITDPQLNYTYCMKSIPLKPNASNQKPKHIEFNIKKYLHLLHHERIVQYFGMKTSGRKIFIFMEYVEGIPLDKRINKKPLPHNKVIQYSKEILEGLKFLHRNKIIHRDIKPQNIMLNSDDHVKICDFGLSCYLDSIRQGSQIQTADSSSKMTLCGTPNYMAPELVSDQKYSYPVDIWALGASVVEMLTGLQPFHGMGNFAIIYHIGHLQKIDFVPAEPMSDDMKSFVDQMLCPCPSTRATAKKLLEFIDEVLEIPKPSSRKKIKLNHENC